MNLVSNLEQELGPDKVQISDTEWTDIGGDAIGVPLCTVTPENAAEVVTIIQLARETSTSVVPVGQRTAYWSPLRIEGAIALDTSRIRGIERTDDVVTVGCGEPVRPLDRWLRSQGLALPVHPDAFGETSVGSMVATGLTSGIGMARGGIDRWITSLTIVTGTGEIIHTGTSAGFRGTEPYLRDGLPDPTGLFLGSEGTLGIIVGVSLRVVPTPWVVHVEGTHPDPVALLRCGRSLCRDGLCDTFRAVREHEPRREGRVLDTPWTFWVSVDSPLDMDDAQSRAIRVQKHLESEGISVTASTAESDSGRAGTDEEGRPRWQGPMGAHAVFQEREYLVGLDINTSYANAEKLLSIADSQAEDALRLSPSMVRTALYLAPGFVNLGMHTSVPRTKPAQGVHEHRSHWLAELSQHPVVPYRLGHAWPSEMVAKILPSRRILFRQFKDLLDPDGILNPQHPLVSP